MRPLAITGARVIDPASGFDAVANVVLRDRIIASVGNEPPPLDAEIIDAAGLVLAPGLVDAGVFRADPAACHVGGITRIVLMPDQAPPLDDPAFRGTARARI